MTKKNKENRSESLECSPIMSLWLWSELEDLQESCQSTHSSESKSSETPSEKRKRNTHRHLCKMTVAVSDSGRPVGEDHIRAKYLDEDIEHALALRHQGYTYQQISEMLDMPIRTVRDYISGKRRNTSIAGFKIIKRYVQ